MVWRETLSRNRRQEKQKVAEYKINDMSGQSRHAAVPKKPVWALLGIKSFEEGGKRQHSANIGQRPSQKFHKDRNF